MDTNDYKKTKNVVQYLGNTKSLTLSIEPGQEPKWWVDSSYAIHPDMRSHKGIYIYTQQRSHVHSLITQTKSSTEAELVAVDDAMGQVLWTRHFLASQGQNVPTTTIYQDNKSTILLSENGEYIKLKKDMSYQHSFFFVADRIKKGEVKVAYCPTTNMLSDFFTKLLQGSTFKKMRNVILNLPDTDKANAKPRSVLENEKEIRKKCVKNPRQKENYQRG